MKKKNDSSQKTKDKQLVDAAVKFLAAYTASADKNGSGEFDFVNRPFSFREGVIVEITEEIIEAERVFVGRAAQLLASKAAHEKAISGIAANHAHKYVAERQDITAAATAMIKEIFDNAAVSFEYMAPNWLVRFVAGIDSVVIGRVAARRTSEFWAAYKREYPTIGFDVEISDEFFFSPNPLRIGMRGVCWVVNVDAVKENVEEEGKWLVDVAVALLRISHPSWKGHFPKIDAVEPHPIRKSQFHNESIKMQADKISALGSSVPPWYEIDDSVIQTVGKEKFKNQALLIFDPPKKSLAERIYQGLGWLTRGRQSEDRAERFLYFFTAIEALLSMDDKTAPVIQTIARHASVILANDNARRAAIAADIKQLYSYRSSLVHTGNRSIRWGSANSAHILAEQLFRVVLEKTDLRISHESFCNDLAQASYGSEWPAAKSP